MPSSVATTATAWAAPAAAVTTRAVPWQRRVVHMKAVASSALASGAWEIRVGDPPSLVAIKRLVGLDELKRHAQELTDAVALERERGDDPKQKPLSMVLTGNPGTGEPRLPCMQVLSTAPFR